MITSDDTSQCSCLILETVDTADGVGESFSSLLHIVVPLFNILLIQRGLLHKFTSLLKFLFLIEAIQKQLVANQGVSYLSCDDGRWGWSWECPCPLAVLCSEVKAGLDVEELDMTVAGRAVRTTTSATSVCGVLWPLSGGFWGPEERITGFGCWRPGGRFL